MRIPSCICPTASVTLIPMIDLRNIGISPARPGLGAILEIGLIPKLLPIITVAVPGPA